MLHKPQHEYPHCYHKAKDSQKLFLYLWLSPSMVEGIVGILHLSMRRSLGGSMPLLYNIAQIWEIPTEGKARLRHGMSEPVILEEVEVEQRAPILKVYLQKAPGARPHIPFSKGAPVSEFQEIASKYPVFRVVSDSGAKTGWEGQ
jgi:hypothetical protein